jgi:hypothetical protein
VEFIRHQAKYGTDVVPSSLLVELKGKLSLLPEKPKLRCSTAFKKDINEKGWHKIELFCRHEAALVALLSLSVGHFVQIK